jgi:SAM-dependent MidA family methyltransferase
MDLGGPPEAAGARRLARFRELAAAASEPDGFVPFDRWMDLVLYAEGLGYYARDRSPIGPAGDFYTAPQVHPLFAATLADRLQVIRTRLGLERPFSLVEVGPGDGTLLAGVLTAWRPLLEAPDRVTVVLIERSSPLRARALRRSHDAAGDSGIRVRAEETVGSLGPFEGAVVANELLDALPVRRFRRRAGAWRELGVRWGDDGLRAAEGPVGEPAPSPALPSDVPDGTVFEYSAAAEGFVREVADHLVDGVLLLDDYGMEEEELLRGHPGGTLATVRGHRAGDDPLAGPGENDLSAFVNWTRIRSAARAAGLAVVADRSQAEALGAWGFERRFEAALGRAGTPEAQVRLRLAAKNLLFGFERFRVVELAPARTAERYRDAT